MELTKHEFVHFIQHNKYGLEYWLMNVMDLKSHLKTLYLKNHFVNL